MGSHMTSKFLAAPKEVKNKATNLDIPAVYTTSKELKGVDVFVDIVADVHQVHEKVAAAGTDRLKLTLIGNRGAKVWPDPVPGMGVVDQWRCRFLAADSVAINHSDIVALLNRLSDTKIDFVQTENLYTFDGQPGYSIAQGESH